MDYNGFNITYVSKWIPVSEIPSNGNKVRDRLNEAYGKSGVYQVAERKDIADIGDNLVHAKIGYNGKSGDILSRTYDIRQPKGSHGAGRYIRQNDICKETEAVIRYVYCPLDEISDLEKSIHDETFKLYGYRFAWVDASAGNAGAFSQFLELAKKLSKDELLDSIASIKQIAREKNEEEFEQQLSEV